MIYFIEINPRLSEPSFAWTLGILDHRVDTQAATSGCPKPASYCWPVGSRLVPLRNVPNPVLGRVLLSPWCRRSTFIVALEGWGVVQGLPCLAVHPPLPPHSPLCPVWLPELPLSGHREREGQVWGCSSPAGHGPPCAMKGLVPHGKSWEVPGRATGPPKKGEKGRKIKALISAEPRGFHTQKGSLLRADEAAACKRTGQLSWAGAFSLGLCSACWQGFVMQIFFASTAGVKLTAKLHK